MLAPSDVVREHWPEYLMEAAGLGLFMISAAVVTSLLEYPHSPLYELLPDPVIRRVLIGIAMGLTAIGIIYSPWGKRSGAHLNPAVTVTFFRLGKLQGLDALFYVLAQFVGGVIGLLVAAMAIGMAIEHPTVNYVVTVPGHRWNLDRVRRRSVHLIWAHARCADHIEPVEAECLDRYLRGRACGDLYCVEAPLSGMSMNPARSFASALPAHLWTDFWVYLTAPLLGMLLAAECYVRFPGAHRILCAKLHHHNNERCIFRCNFMA